MRADKYGVLAERIRQIDVKAMKQMRKVIENSISRSIQKKAKLCLAFFIFAFRVNAHHVIYIKVSLRVTH